MAPHHHGRIPSAGKIYVVFKGRNPGFYSSWPECQAEVSGFADNLHKAYKTMAEAESAWLRYWSRRAAFGEVNAAATALEGEYARDATLMEDDHCLPALVMHDNEDDQTASGVIGGITEAGRNPWWPMSLALAIMAVLWVLYGWM